MKRLTAALLVAIGLASAGTAFAQSNTSYDRYANGYEQNDAYYDYARVIRVDPVFDGRTSQTSGYGSNGQRCYQSTTAGSYGRNDGYGSDGYRNDGYRNDGYRDPYGNPQYGSTMGRNVATIAGGVVGAVLGSKVGGGSGSVAASAIGGMVGGMAGRQIYDNAQQNRNVRQGTVTVCDPVPVGRDSYGYGNANAGRASTYDVTYEYNGRRYTRRMDYDPGERVRVRVDVVPQ